MRDRFQGQTQLRRRSFLGAAAAFVVGGCGAPAKPFDDAIVRATYPPIGRFVTVEGLRIHYWEKGTGQHVILVHGASGNLRDWTFHLADVLAERYRVIAFDRPGLGYSERAPTMGWDPAVQARILRKAAGKLGAEHPVLVGHSWGGALIMAWAIDAPGELAGLVPVSSVTIPYGGIASVVNALGLDGWIINAYTQSMLERAHEGGIMDFIARVFRPQRIPKGYVDYVGAPLALREDTLRANGEDLQYINGALGRLAPAYPTVGVRTEIIHGEADFIDWDDQAQPLYETLPNANLTLLPGVGHMAHHAAPGALVTAIDRLARSA